MNRMHSLTLAALSALLVGVSASGLAIAWAKPISYRLPDETAKFKAAAGVEIVQNNCTACHSSDYIETQPRAQKSKKEGVDAALVGAIHRLERVGRRLARQGDELGVGGRASSLAWPLPRAAFTLAKGRKERQRSSGRRHSRSLTAALVAVQRQLACFERPFAYFCGMSRT